MFEPTDLASSEIALTFKRYALQQVVNRDLAFEVDASVQQSLWGDLVYRLTAHVLADQLPPEEFTARQHVTYEVPASTWQMWKKRHARRWYARRLVARWPVRYEADPELRGTEVVCSFDLERWRSYPQAQYLPRDRFGDAVRVHAIRDLRWTDEAP